MVVDAQNGGCVVFIVIADDGRDVQSAHCAVIHHLVEELSGIGRCGAGIEVPPQGSDATHRICTHTFLTCQRVVEGFTNEQTHLFCRPFRCHLLQRLDLIHDGVDVAFAVVVGIHDALVEDGIRQVVNEHLNTDIRWSGVFLRL